MDQFYKTFHSNSLMDIQDFNNIQNVKPIEDLDTISALWPVDDNPDELLEFILSERNARRHLKQFSK